MSQAYENFNINLERVQVLYAKKGKKGFFKNVFIHGYIYMRIVNTDFWSINLDPLFLFQGITGILLDKI